MTENASVPVCQSGYNHNRTLVLYDAYSGIPGTLAINAIAFVVLLLLFTLLRKIAWDYGRLALVNRTEEKWTSLFYGDHDKRSLGSQESVDTTVNLQDKGVFRWIVAFVMLKDTDIFHKCGRDAVQYLSFQRHLLVYVTVITVISVGVVLPVNFQGNLLGNATEFGHTTIGNLDSDSPLLWVHATLAVLYFIILIIILRHFHTNLDVEEDEQVSRTLMISNIPHNKCFAENIQLHFREAYPEMTVCDIQFAYNITELVSLDKQKKAAREARIYSEMQLHKTGKRPVIYPYTCGRFCCSPCCGCKEVDAINFYMDEEAELQRACDEEREIAHKTAIGIAFVTFESEMQAQRVRADFRANCKGTHNPQMSSVYMELHVQDWQVHFAPPPESIYWENLSVPEWKWWTKAFCINGFLLVLLFFLTTPIMILHSLDLLNIDIKKPVEEHLHSPLLVQFLPTLLLWTFSALLPNLVYYSDQYMGHWTKTSEHHAIMRKTFVFLLLMVLILPSLGLTSAHAFFEWAVIEDQKKLQWQCIFMPSNGSFFVNYVITAAFIGTALELLRFSELFMYGIRLLIARSNAEKAAVRKAVLWDFQYGMQYAWMLCIFAIIISYSIPCPLVTPFGLVYLALKHLVDRYNIFFAYNSSNINRHIHNSAVTFVLWSVIMLQISVTFFTGLRAEGMDPVFIFSSVALFISIIIFVGRLSFGWFRHLRPSRYRVHTTRIIEIQSTFGGPAFSDLQQFDEGDALPIEADATQKPFIAEILLNQASPEMPISSSQHSHPSYGATADTADVQSTNNRG
ncbi:CSC1-like protein 2 isoform X4 [Pomacea canaliculata]|uniref:CSC1-like protein 2 isoform X4 n=1 Tax=Pomacea canaliculata TaxID=400727 RepID=UPI000D726F84|nr:CSC1-like protein 2 isoform X4 [Pomacea canaliculata]